MGAEWTIVLNGKETELVPHLGDGVAQNPTRKRWILLEESSLAHAASLGFCGFSNQGYLQVVALVTHKLSNLYVATDLGDWTELSNFQCRVIAISLNDAVAT